MAKKTAGFGRPKIFDKDGPDVHGRISKAAGQLLEQRRQTLMKLYRQIKGADWKGKISDGDVIEYLIRGDVSSKLVLKGEL